MKKAKIIYDYANKRGRTNGINRYRELKVDALTTQEADILKLQAVMDQKIITYYNLDECALKYYNGKVHSHDKDMEYNSYNKIRIVKIVEE